MLKQPLSVAFWPAGTGLSHWRPAYCVAIGDDRCTFRPDVRLMLLASLRDYRLEGPLRAAQPLAAALSSDRIGDLSREGRPAAMGRVQPHIHIGRNAGRWQCGTTPAATRTKRSSMKPAVHRAANSLKALRNCGSATPQAGQLPPKRHADRSAGAYCPNLLGSRKFGIL